MSQNDAMLWNHKPTPVTRTPRPTEPLWTVVKGTGRVDAELLGQGEWGWEVRLLRDGRFYGSRRFNLRAQAVEYGDLLRRDLKGIGWL